MARILILDQDRQFLAGLYETLFSNREHEIITTIALQEACLIVSQQPQDVAFIGLEPGSDTIIHSLRSLQPDLRIILLTDASGRAFSRAVHDQVQGILPHNPGAVSGDVVNAVLSRPVSQTLSTNGAAGQLIAGMVSLTAVLQQAIVDKQILTALLSNQDAVLTHAGTLDETQVNHAARQIWHIWQEASEGKIQVSFASLPGRVSEVMLFARMIDRRRLLTLIAQPDTPITPLRQTTEKLLPELAVMLSAEPQRKTQQPDPITLIEEPEAGINAYALVWRAVEPIPQVLHIPLKRALTRIAQANACLLTYQELQPTHIHLVVTCPPGRDSSWAAHHFKSGTTQEIQAQFGIQANLWLPGYVAIPSTKPLDEQDLALFLSRPVIGAVS